ncbi:cell wall-associated hydrolase [Levilactobacillus brevis]|uniref:hypothetical protein n=1 Tax=Levilactobacillus brevis TaxID=1580 RepID=UPI000DFFD4C3|nr:hypothetical protein [Levilactobacillus brevis]STX22949.1 cell wall-associated hydrolase [Levilactobacillus brevis]
MEIRRIKVATALIWATPTTSNRADQAYLKTGDLTTWVKALKPVDQIRLARSECHCDRSII